MLKTFINAFQDKQTRRKILITLGILFAFRLGCYIPIPGIDLNILRLAAEDGNTFFQVLSTISGGAMSQGTVFALGILPYINASIIMQLLTLIIPALERLTKEGDEGRNKIAQYTKYAGVLLGIVQGIGIVIMWNNYGAIQETFGSKAFTGFEIIMLLTAGSMFVMWMCDRITEFGVGNGSSLIIFTGIISSAFAAIMRSFKIMKEKPIQAWYFVGFIIFVVLIFLFIVFVELAERKIPVRYAKQVKGNKVYGGQSTHIPMKVNASGVMPIIFASAFLMFPQMIAGFWPESEFYKWYSKYLGVSSWVYAVVLALLILFFSYFYAQIQFNPIEVSRNIQQYGGTIIGIRPGKPTSDYLNKINNRLTLFGAIFLAILSLVPSIVFRYLGKDLGLTNAFSATGLLIIVSVAIEWNKQIEQELMMKHYKGFLR